MDTDGIARQLTARRPRRNLLPPHVRQQRPRRGGAFSTALRVCWRSRRSSLLGVTKGVQAEFCSAWMMRAATAWELLEKASSSTMVQNMVIAPGGTARSSATR